MISKLLRELVTCNRVHQWQLYIYWPSLQFQFSSLAELKVLIYRSIYTNFANQIGKNHDISVNLNVTVLKKTKNEAAPK